MTPSPGSSSALSALRLFFLTLLLASAAADAAPPDLTGIADRSMREGDSLDIALEATDPDGDNVTFTASNLPSFCLITDDAGPNGNIQCNPGESDAGATDITVRATDVNSEFTETTFELTVTANGAPSIDAIADQSVREGNGLNITMDASDPEGDSLTWSAPGGIPSFCTFTDTSGNNGDIDCAPGAGDATVVDITVRVTDDATFPAFGEDTFQLTVAANTPPNVTNITNQSVAEGATLDIALSGSDSDGDSLTWTTSNLPTFCSITDGSGNSGNIRCTPQAGDASVTVVTVRATDNGPLPEFTEDTFQLTVGANSAPVITPIADRSVAEGGSVSIAFSAADPDAGDTLTFSTTNLPSFCALTDATGPDGQIECNPGAGDASVTTITVTVSDNAPVPASDSDQFDLTVTANAAPVLTPIPDQSVGEGGTLVIPLSASDADVGDTLTFSTTNLPTFCSLTDSTGPDGSITCNPNPGDEGSTTVSVTVTDNATLPRSDSDLFQLTVSANTPPVLTPIDDQTMTEEEVLNIPLSANDPDGGDVTFSETGLPLFCTLTDNLNGTGSIGCSPAIGNAGVFAVTITATDDGTIPASTSDGFQLTVEANEPPEARDVAITGTLALGELLTGTYTYSDAEGDLEGVSTFRWLRDGTAIPGETGTTYTVAVADIEAALVFEATPVAQTGALQGAPVQSPEVTVDNVAPSITGQDALQTAEDTAIVVSLDNLTVDDSDNDYPADFTIEADDGPNWTQVSAPDNKSVTITPALDFNGDLTVPVRVNDGIADSPSFDLLITVTAVNDAPVITGLVSPISTPEDTPFDIEITDLTVTDPDNSFPTGFTLTLQSGANYTVDGNTITPAENFNGQLSVPATVNDGELNSAVFNIPVTVTSVNDVPVLDTPIADQQAVEDSPFNLNVSGNFSDPEGDRLTFSVSWTPVRPPSISFNSQNGVFSGTPREADANPPGPTYTATVTASDPSGDFATDSFDLTISLRDRANLSLSLEVEPETGNPGDDLRWTMTARNPVGPQPGQNVELTGSFVGTGLTVTAEAGATCAIQAPVNDVTDFTCQLGTLPVGGNNATVFTTSTSVVTEIVAFATVAGAQADPIDPNEDDNSDTLAAGIGEAFSVGAVQILGNAAVHSVTAGDVNGDDLTDLIVGTAAGQSVQVFINAAQNEACQCQRDFATAPISVPGTNSGANDGVALADFDGNGTLDLVVVNGGGQADAVYSNDGSGNFSPMATLGNSFGQAVAVGDFNNDGNRDIAIAAVGGNPVYHGNGNGGFSLHATLGNANSLDVAVAEFDANGRGDLVFANVGSASRVWTKNSGAGFSSADQLNIGDAVAVAAGQLNGDQRPDLVFGRVPNDVGDVPANPVFINNGNGTFPNAAEQLLGISPTNDVHIGDIDRDGLQDIVFVNASGVHQIWMQTGSWSLHREQIIDGGAIAGVLADLGDVSATDSGGVDLAMGGALGGGLAVYLNDGAGNLGRGDTEPPVLTLLGSASVVIESGDRYIDAGATASDNIDGDISNAIRVTGSVNTASVGNYTLTYDVTDFAGNTAVSVTRSVRVDPSAGSGGGGGGSLSYLTVLALLGALLVAVYRRRKELI